MVFFPAPDSRTPRSDRRKIIARLGSRRSLRALIGTLSISLPWIFSSRIPVFIICGASIALLLSMRYVPLVRGHLSGRSIYDRLRRYFADELV
jgi:hypothetical protein